MIFPIQFITIYFTQLFRIYSSKLIFCFCFLFSCLIFVSYRCRFDNLCCAITRKTDLRFELCADATTTKIYVFLSRTIYTNKNTRHSFEHTNMNKFNHTNTRHKSNHQRFTLSLTSNTNTHKKNM